MKTARILIIAGSDSSGGAGIQADIKTVTMLGGHAMTAITAVTAQNTQGVGGVHPIPKQMVLDQIEACVSDIGVDAVKIGMIGSAETAMAVAEYLEALTVPIVFDPVMVATSGSTLVDDATIAAFDRLIALATIVTPNTPELAALSGRMIANEIDQAEAAEEIMLRTGCPAVLAKGGHLIEEGETYGFNSDGTEFRYRNAGRVFDYLYQQDATGWHERLWDNPRLETRHTHGTGCTLASGVATGLGAGMAIDEAIERAIAFVQAALLNAPCLGDGSGPIGHALGVAPFDALSD